MESYQHFNVYERTCLQVFFTKWQKFNGFEFAEHRKLHSELGVNIYLAAPRSPWERPTNEKVKRLLHFFLSKRI